jgi:hypothetical protein
MNGNNLYVYVRLSSIYCSSECVEAYCDGRVTRVRFPRMGFDRAINAMIACACCDGCGVNLYDLSQAIRKDTTTKKEVQA